MSRFRPSIERMEGYTPGEQPQEQGVVKLNTNENPYPPSPRALEAIREWTGPRLRLYPQPLAQPVRERVARIHGLRPENVIVGNGSDDILTIILRSFADPGQAIAYPSPSYSLYTVLAEIQGARVVEIPFPDDFALPEGLFGADARIVFLPNPNSPTGTVAPPDDVSRLAESLSGVLVVDEAYADFAERDCMELAKRHENVIITRSFSKSFALCGLRLGYGVANETLIEGMMKVKDSYNVNRLACEAGAAALDDIAYMRAQAARIKDTRQRLAESLEALGWFVFPSQANFVLARLGSASEARKVYESLKARKILVRYFDLPGLDDCLRITVGTDNEVDALLRNLEELTQE